MYNSVFSRDRKYPNGIYLAVMELFSTLKVQNIFYRLTDGPNHKSGRVEVKHNGVWGTICDDNFGENESQVICRMLGFSSNVGKIYNGSISAYQGNGPIWVRYGI